MNADVDATQLLSFNHVLVQGLQGLQGLAYRYGKGA
jgi:hypothetical protein